MTNSKDLIGCCGLYCGECFNYKGRIADLSRNLRKELREAKFNQACLGLSKFFKEFENYEQCYKVLGAMVGLRCKRTCRGGGGPPSCRIRSCCQKKNIRGCWECTEFETCEKLDFLNLIHGDAHLRNLRTIKKHGTDSFLEGTRNW